MLIRAAVPADIPQMMILAAQSGTAAHWTAREYEALFEPAAPARVALVALQDMKPGAVAGVVIARCGKDEWEIENLVVETKLRKQGIARSLLEELLRQARNSGVTEVLLEVRESNFAARALYTRAGFKEAGRRRAYYQNPEEDALVLRTGL